MNKIVRRDLLRFSPYDNKTEQNYPVEKYPQESPEDYFWNHIFVDYPPVCNLKIKDFWKAVTDSSINTILFYGYSGTGKTTFLHYIDRKYKTKYSDFFDSDFVNLIRKPGSTSSNSLMNSLLNHKIEENLTEEVVEQFISYYDRYVDDESNNDREWPSDFLKDTNYDYTGVFINFLTKCSFKFSKQNVQKLCDSIKIISEKIAFYVICFIINKCIKKNKLSVVYFDNLDELDQIHLSQLLDDDLHTAYSKAQSFFDCFVPDYDFTTMCTFVKSIRNTNNTFRNRSQLNDRCRLTLKEIRFDCVPDSYEIIKKRSLKKDGGVLQLIKMEKVFLKNDISKLYNFDIRAILFSIGDVFSMAASTILHRIIVDNDCKVVGRGCILFRTLQARNNVTDPPFLLDATEAIRLKYCDVLRLALTVLSNMSNGTKSNQLNKNEKTTQIQSVSLVDFTERMEFWYGASISIKDLYRKVFVSSSHNYSMPATLSGTEIEQFIRANSKTDLADISDFCAELYLSNRSKLDGVRITVHPLCEVYVDKVFIHFEYFNCLSLLDNEIDASDKEPHCSLLECQSMEEAASCMERVFQTTLKIIKIADDNFCQKCNTSKNCVHGKNSKNCKLIVKDMSDNNLLIKNTLYASRVITSHINYLDAYRKYIWKIEESPDNNAIKTQLKPNLLKEIVLKYIKKYVKLCNMNGIKDEAMVFQRKVYDNNIAQSIQEIENNLMFQERNKDKWIAIKGHIEKGDAIIDDANVGFNEGSELQNDQTTPQTYCVNGCCFVMKPVEKGEFEMGDDEEMDAIRHKVHLKDYYIGETPVTQKLWKAVMGTNPSSYVDENNPVESVSWKECGEFVTKLNTLLGLNFRLPTEAEWEYAARGGNGNSKYRYSGSDDIQKVAWYNRNSNDCPHQVKKKRGNDIGIYDMSGNVCEWCCDWYGDFTETECNNPTGPTIGSTRVVRGGSWYNSEDYCLINSRWHYDPQDKEDYIGFRLALDVPFVKTSKE